MAASHAAVVHACMHRTPERHQQELYKFGGRKRTTGEAGIVTTGAFRELDWDYSGY